MRSIFITLAILFAVSAAGQSGLPAYQPATPLGYYPSRGLGWTDPSRKWSVQGYSGFSTSFMHYNGGNATMFSAPIGMQLSRRLNNNFYAFGAVSVAPTYTNFNHSFMTPGQFNTTPGYFNPNGMNLYQRAELGLMYVNDARTFSISGSIGVQRGGNPFYPVGPVGNTKPANAPISHH